MDGAAATGAAARRTSGAASLLVAEAQLHADLEMTDGIVDDVAADFGHLEPLEVPQRLRGGADGVADRVVERVGQGAVDLGDGIDVARHGAVPPIPRSEEHQSELQSLMRITYHVFSLQKNITKTYN